MKTVLLIHGIGDQDETWHLEASAIIKRNIPSLQDVVPFHWMDLLDGAPQAKRLRACSHLSRVAAVGVWWMWLTSPLINWMLNRAGDLLGYHIIRYQAFKRLDKAIEDIEGDVVIVAHSLGSVLAFEYLAIQDNPRVVKLITLGSPLDRNPVKGRVLKRMKGKTSLKLPWVNVWGTRDPVVCWTPWRGEMNTFKPSEQQSIERHAHGLEGYVQAIEGLV